MATKYRISESGIQKVVEILDGDTVVGIRKFSPKEISVSYSGDTVQINDTFTGNTLFEGPSANFVKSDNSAFAETAGDAVLAMTDLANNIAINVTELDGIQLINDAIAPDLSAYAQKTYVDQEITAAKAYTDTEVSAAETTLNNSISTVTSTVSTLDTTVGTLSTDIAGIPKILAQSSTFTMNFNASDQIRCKAASAVTFTAPANGKVRYVSENHKFISYGLAEVRAWMSTVAPENGEVNIVVEPGDLGYTFGAPDWLDDNVASGAVGTTGAYIVPIQGVMVNAESRESMDELITGLTPGQEYTIYLWGVTGVFGNSNYTNITFNNGIKIVEVL